MNNQRSEEDYHSVTWWSSRVTVDPLSAVGSNFSCSPHTERGGWREVFSPCGPVSAAGQQRLQQIKLWGGSVISRWRWTGWAVSASKLHSLKVNMKWMFAAWSMFSLFYSCLHNEDEQQEFHWKKKQRSENVSSVVFSYSFQCMFLQYFPIRINED